MSWQGVVWISAGAVIGALCRFGLSFWFNGERFAWGTLLANLLGGYLIGVAIASFTRWPTIPPEIRLGLVTGFLGALTTFSSFSGEVVMMLSSREYRWAMAFIVMHVFGSLAATLLGMWTLRH